MTALWAAGLAAVVAVVAVQRTRAEPRRLGNAFWLLAAVLLLLGAALELGLPGGFLLGLLGGGLLLLSPLLVLVLAVLLVANGVTMLRREGRSLGNLLSLLGGIGLLGLVATPLLLLLSGLQPVVLAVVLAVDLAAGYLGFVLLAFLGYSWLYPALVRHRPAEWVVVLGSGLGEGSRVTPLLAARIRTGIDQARVRGARRLVVSGGQGEDEQLPEGEAMARWARDVGGLGVTAGDPQLLLETASRTTEQNLRNTAVVLAATGPGTGPGSEPGSAPTPAPSPGATGALVADGAGSSPTGSSRTGSSRTPPPSTPGLVVTSSYHVLRAAMLARRLGLPAQAVGAPVARYFWPSAVLREYVAVLTEHRWVHLVLAALVALPLPAAVLLLAAA